MAFPLYQWGSMITMPGVLQLAMWITRMYSNKQHVCIKVDINITTKTNGRISRWGIKHSMFVLAKIVI